MHIKKLTIPEMVNDPYGAYLEFRQRLQTYGLNAPFPEFEEVVRKILSDLDSEEFRKVFRENPAFGLELTEVKIMFAHVNLEFVFDDESAYPYLRPFQAPFPYRPTIDAIESGIRLLDKLNRLQEGNPAVPLYHFDRYAYHRHALVADPEIILFPTVQNLSPLDLIKIRPVNIGLLGVFTRTIRVDRHWQSPLDFWYHDINHVRRMFQYVQLSLRKQNIRSETDKLSFYGASCQFMQESVLPYIEPASTDPAELQGLKKLALMIIFEIFHETALGCEKKSIVEDLFRPAIAQPFEHMVVDDAFNPQDIERLRTPTGNLKTGASYIEADEYKTIKIRYFYDRALGLLANVYNKLNFGFYDNPDYIDHSLVPAEFRTPNAILKAVHYILDFLKIPDRPADAYILDLINSKEGSEEKFVYKGLSNKDDKDKQYATDPISASKAVAEIKGLNKKICSLFGYSLLEYEDKVGVLGQIKKDLSVLDPDEWLVNIGATEEGIGAAYKVAKELGFTTIGIVSTQALFYSGKFSEYVDRIYIINDMNWGGYIPGTTKLAPTTKVYLSVSDMISAYGGGENTAVILKLAKEAGLPLSYHAADMNHAIGLQELGNRGDFQGAAYKQWKM